MPKQSPTRRFGDRFATIVPNDDGDCFAKTARNDTGLNGYELNTFLITAVKVWLMRRERFPDETQHPWSEAFQESAVAFVDQLIDENRVLFEELALL